MSVNGNRAIAASKKNITPPPGAGQWSIDKIIFTLSRRLPREELRTLKDKGNAAYIPWYSANAILDKYAPGWGWEIKSINISRDTNFPELSKLYLIGSLSIPCAEGTVSRAATGSESLCKKYLDKKTGEIFYKDLPYGDASSNAESMAFRRAAARFGLGLYLYE